MERRPWRITSRRRNDCSSLCASAAFIAQCGAPDDRLSADMIHRAHGATRGCIAHVQRPRTCTRISGSPAAALSTCCPQADRATDTGPAPVRSQCLLGHSFFLFFFSFFAALIVFRDENSPMRCTFARDIFANCDQVIKEESFAVCLSCVCSFYVLFEEKIRRKEEYIIILIKSLIFQSLPAK